MKKTYPNKIKIEFDFTNEERTYSKEEIVNDYIFRCLENIERAVLDKYINTYGDPTCGLWNQVEILCTNFVSTLEKIIETNDLEYSNFIINNIEQFLTKDRKYRQQNQKLFLPSLDIENLDDESFVCELLGLKSETKDVRKNLEKIKSKYYFEDSEEVSHCIKKDYIASYGDIIGKVFTQLEIFHEQTLEIYEDAMKINDSNFSKFVSNNIDEFLIRDQKYLNAQLKRSA